MGALILILLLLAALTGVFWTVVKVTVVAILSTILFFVVLAYVGVWFLRRRWHRFVNDPETQRRMRGAGTPPGPGGAIPAEGRKEPDERLP
jgi:Kef-type K+ transport system membrane component KefB